MMEILFRWWSSRYSPKKSSKNKNIYASKSLPNLSDLSFRRHSVKSSVVNPFRQPFTNNGVIHRKNSCDIGLAPFRGFLRSGFLPASIVVSFLFTAFTPQAEMIYNRAGFYSTRHHFLRTYTSIATNLT